MVMYYFLSMDEVCEAIANTSKVYLNWKYRSWLCSVGRVSISTFI